MKKFLKNYDFEDNFDSTILSRGKSYYRENRILDIWCQDDKLTAYIDGTEIYIVELKASILSSKNKQRFYEFINN